MKKTNQDISIATSLHHLRMALKLICPNEDWSWVSTIIKRIAAAAPSKPKKYGQVSSVELYQLGLKLIDEAVAETAEQNKSSKASALKYRDGLLIAFLSLVVLRLRTGHQNICRLAATGERKFPVSTRRSLFRELQASIAECFGGRGESENQQGRIRSGRLVWAAAYPDIRLTV